MASNPIVQVVAAFSGLITTLIMYVIFSPLINNTLPGLVNDALDAGAGTMLDTNASALALTVKLIVMGIKVILFFVVFAIFARLFIYIGYYTEEMGVY